MTSCECRPVLSRVSIQRMQRKTLAYLSDASEAGDAGKVCKQVRCEHKKITQWKVADASYKICISSVLIDFTVGAIICVTLLLFICTVC